MSDQHSLAICDCGAIDPKSARFGHRHLAWCPRALQQPSPFHTDCPNCHGSGECSNRQFRCHCRHHRSGCALVSGRGDCDCQQPSPAPPPVSISPADRDFALAKAERNTDDEERQHLIAIATLLAGRDTGHAGNFAARVLAFLERAPAPPPVGEEPAQRKRKHRRNCASIGVGGAVDRPCNCGLLELEADNRALRQEIERWRQAHKERLAGEMEEHERAEAALEMTRHGRDTAQGHQYDYVVKCHQETLDKLTTARQQVETLRAELARERVRIVELKQEIETLKQENA